MKHHEWVGVSQDFGKLYRAVLCQDRPTSVALNYSCICPADSGKFIKSICHIPSKGHIWGHKYCNIVQTHHRGSLCSCGLCKAAKSRRSLHRQAVYSQSKNLAVKNKIKKLLSVCCMLVSYCWLSHSVPQSLSQDPHRTGHLMKHTSETWDRKVQRAEKCGQEKNKWNSLLDCSFGSIGSHLRSKVRHRVSQPNQTRGQTLSTQAEIRFTLTMTRQDHRPLDRPWEVWKMEAKTLWAADWWMTNYASETHWAVSDKLIKSKKNSERKFMMSN